MLNRLCKGGLTLLASGTGGPSVMIREPARAGTSYPASPAECRQQLSSFDRAVSLADLPGGRLLGGIVPHAGWAFSGQVAWQVFSALAASHQPRTVVIFGAVHYRRGQHAWLFGAGRWDTPLGPVDIDERLAERVLGHTNLVVNDAYAHEKEHSIEVQLPFIQMTMPDATILPIMVPPMAAAAEVGEAVAGTVAAYDNDVMFLGSTDLTHYGPSYGMVSHGVGRKGIAWAKDVNDRRMIDLMVQLDVEGVVPEAAERFNACGAGAVAATLAAVKRLGAQRGVLLTHTNSAEVMELSSRNAGDDAVGYAGVVFEAGSMN